MDTPYDHSFNYNYHYQPGWLCNHWWGTTHHPESSGLQPFAPGTLGLSPPGIAVIPAIPATRRCFFFDWRRVWGRKNGRWISDDMDIILGVLLNVWYDCWWTTSLINIISLSCLSFADQSNSHCLTDLTQHLKRCLTIMNRSFTITNHHQPTVKTYHYAWWIDHRSTT